MTTILTEIGWSDANGNPLGTWTNQADLVDEGDEITLAEGVTANSRAGDDTIIYIDETAGGGDVESAGISINGTLKTGAGKDTIDTLVEFFSGINNTGTIDTGVGRDTISGDGDVTGITNSGTITTGLGGDTISGSGDVGLGINNESNGIINTGVGRDTIGAFSKGGGILNDGIINTGAGTDEISAGSLLGIAIDNSGTINTGAGADIIDASFGAVAGIKNDGTINTGAGADIINAGSGDVAGDIDINNSGTINTGAGADIIDALNGGFDGLTGGFGGGGTIDLGRGDDLIRGFGQQIVDGDRGFDTAELRIDFEENLITFGSTGSTSIDITFDSVTMSFTDVELFDFNGQEFALEQLQDIVQ